MSDSKLPTGREQFESLTPILRDRLVWLKGELKPPNRELHDISELILIHLEIRLINDLLELWRN